MLHDHRARRAGFLAGLACLALSAAPAGALADTPTPCGGEPLVVDKSGDQVTDPGGTGLLEAEGAPDTDILQGFFTYADQGGKKVLTANTVIRNLTADVPASATALYYYTLFVVGGATKYVVYRNDGSGTPVFKYGTFDPSLGTYTNEGDTTGALVPGANGVVSVVVPDALGIKEGQDLKTVQFNVDEIYGVDDEEGLNVHADQAPETGGPTYTVAPCATTAPTDTTPAPGTTPAPTATPTPTPSTGPATLPLRTALFIGSAKKAKAKATLRFQIKADAPISGLKLTLKASNGKGAVLGTASLKTVKKGISVAKLKLKKRLKKGKYALFAVGKVDGKTLKAVQQVGVR